MRKRKRAEQGSRKENRQEIFFWTAEHESSGNSPHFQGRETAQIVQSPHFCRQVIFVCYPGFHFLNGTCGYTFSAPTALFILGAFMNAEEGRKTLSFYFSDQ